MLPRQKVGCRPEAFKEIIVSTLPREHAEALERSPSPDFEAQFAVGGNLKRPGERIGAVASRSVALVFHPQFIYPGLVPFWKFRP
jgi:hypothetical protein